MWALLCIPLLADLALSDLRCRKVSVLQLAIFGSLLFLTSVYQAGLRTVLENMLANFGACLALGIALYAWAHLRGHRLADMIGCGDLVFVGLLTPYFRPYDFLLFLTVSCAVTLVVWCIWCLACHRETADTIPLVSGLGLCLTPVILYRTVLPLI